MQTFLPYAGFAASARVLDIKRLGKQRSEALQILNALRDGNGWRKHPAVRMWSGHEQALVVYGLIICRTWTAHGYKDTCFRKILEHRDYRARVIYPPWLGYEPFHRSHRSNLLRKLPEHYSKFFNEPINLEYVWPGIENWRK